VSSLFEFLDNGKTPWHVVAEIEHALSGFTEQDLAKPFKKGLKKFYIKKGGTLIAVKMPSQKPEKIHFAAAHTDSPTLKLKPKPTFTKGSQTFLDVEVYGSPIYSTFLNRDLALAGKVYFEKKGRLESALIDLPENPVIIPKIAIHLDRQVNEKDSINPEKELMPLVGTHEFDLLKHIEKTFKLPTILGHDLFLYPSEKAHFIGFDQDLFASARIDNLGSTYALLQGFLKANQSKHGLQMAIFWNHEEIGSETSEGAASPLFLEVLKRIQIAYSLDEEWLYRARHSSYGLSIDEAHATHASYPDKHDLKHEVKLGGGIAIKTNAKKRYATSGDHTAALKILCKKHHILFQEFINRNDIPCGSTIGPILSARSGFDMIDIGCPELSMHTAREVASIHDHTAMQHLITSYFTE